MSNSYEIGIHSQFVYQGTAGALHVKAFYKLNRVHSVEFFFNQETLRMDWVQARMRQSLAPKQESKSREVHGFYLG